MGLEERQVPYVRPDIDMDRASDIIQPHTAKSVNSGIFKKYFLSDLINYFVIQMMLLRYVMSAYRVYVIL